MMTQDETMASSEAVSASMEDEGSREKDLNVASTSARTKVAIPDKRPNSGKTSLHGSFRKLLKTSKLKEQIKRIKPSYRLRTERQVLEWSLLAVRLGSAADAISTSILTPNYPFLALPGSHPDSFDSTEPFGFSAATYFLPMSALVASALTSSIVGRWSDKYGRRPFLLLCVGVSVFGNLARYWARNTFWGFTAANFVNGLFGSTLTVALAYVSDVHPGRAEKEREIGTLVGINMLAITGGGIIAIVMQQTGLFTPLFFGAGLNLVAFLFMYVYLVEPDESLHFEENVSDEEKKGPAMFDVKLTANVIVGAVFDKIGSAGIFPMALAPLMFETYYSNFLLVGEVPIMSETGYKWITMLLAATVVFGAAMSGPIFERIGPAGGCVFGNLFTAIGTAGCILIARVTDPTKASFIGYVFFLYAINPFTVISNLSTGPMLDRLAPHNRRGFVQGLNVTVMNLTSSISPFALGNFADAVGTTWCMWFCVFISIFATLVNVPLLFAPSMSAPRKNASLDATPSDEIGGNYAPLDMEDTEQIEQVMKGDWVPAKLLEELNMERYNAGLPFLLPPIRSYEEDKDKLCTLYKHAKEDFEYRHLQQYYYLSLQDSPEKKRHVVEQLRISMPSKDVQIKRAGELGQWFADYMNNSGYFLDGGQINLFKQMIMHAFPVINNDGDFTEENIEKTVIRFATVVNRYFLQAAPTKAQQGFSNSVVI